jgi:gamma-glutamyltranspeptidase/glutathione hydrolase
VTRLDHNRQTENSYPDENDYRKKFSKLYSSKIFLAKNSAVATEHPLATMAAIDTLREGGNAADAAVTAGLCLAVAQPHLSGLGGDFFALYYQSASGKVYCLNASGWAPSGLTVDTIKSKGLQAVPLHGPYSVVVPGYVSGIGSLHQRFGELELSKDVEPAIKLADEGFPVYPALCSRTREVIQGLPESAKRIFAPDNQALTPGSLLRQQGLARTLRTIAAQGTAAFYEGAIFESIADTLSRDGPQVDLQDFKSYEPEWCDAIKMDYADLTIYEIPPNSMGATSLRILNSLRTVGLKQFQPNSHERIKATLEVVKDAYAKMWEQLGDPRFTKINMHDFLSPDKTGKSTTISKPTTRNADTTYFAIIDNEGNIISGIQSVFSNFGSRVFVEECGFLNNRASAFKLEGPNRLQPRKRPLHTLSALMLAHEGEMKAAMGTSGAEYRPQQHALFLTNYVDYKMTIEEALAYPRFLWELGKVTIESGFTGLDRIPFNKELVEYPGRTGVAQAVEIINDAKKAVCDIRGEGLPLGF